MLRRRAGRNPPDSFRRQAKHRSGPSTGVWGVDNAEIKMTCPRDFLSRSSLFSFRDKKYDILTFGSNSPVEWLPLIGDAPHPSRVEFPRFRRGNTPTTNVKKEYRHILHWWTRNIALSTEKTKTTGETTPGAWSHGTPRPKTLTLNEPRPLPST